MMSKQPKLDHVVLLLPYSQLQQLPAWVTKHFLVSEGGMSMRCIPESFIWKANVKMQELMLMARRRTSWCYSGMAHISSSSLL